MAELITIARPYAQAVFKRAQETGQTARWSEQLEFAAALANDPTMGPLLSSSRLTRTQLADLFIDIAGDRLDAEGQNLIRVLADNRRLILLPQLAELYEKMRGEAEGTVDAEMVSAYPVDDAQRERIATALTQRLGRQVRLHAVTDENMLGGAVIRAGDMVIDGSVRGKLAKLASALNQ